MHWQVHRNLWEDLPELYDHCHSSVSTWRRDCIQWLWSIESNCGYSIRNVDCNSTHCFVSRLVSCTGDNPQRSRQILVVSMCIMGLRKLSCLSGIGDYCIRYPSIMMFSAVTRMPTNQGTSNPLHQYLVIVTIICKLEGPNTEVTWSYFKLCGYFLLNLSNDFTNGVLSPVSP